MKAVLEKTAVKMKHLMSLLFYVCGISALVNAALKRRYGRKGLLQVLCYHGVEEQQVHAFQRQLDYLLRRGYHFIAGTQLLELIASPESFDTDGDYICITFDDCYENNHSVVRPILIEKKIPAIFFAPSSKLGWVSDWGDGTIRHAVMTAEQLKEMAVAFDIGAHTQHHVKLDTLTPDACLQEIRKSKEELSQLLGRDIVFFAYPNGGYNRGVVQDVQRCQFKAAFTIEQHRNYRYDERHALGRYLIDPEDFLTFKMKVSGGYDWFYFLKKGMISFRARLDIRKKTRAANDHAI